MSVEFSITFHKIPIVETLIINCHLKESRPSLMDFLLLVNNRPILQITHTYNMLFSTSLYMK